MKINKNILIAPFCFIVLTWCTLSCGNKHNDRTSAPKAVLADGIDSLSYAIGMKYSAQPEVFAATLRHFGSDSAHLGKLLEGLRDGITSDNDEELLAYYLGLESGIRMRRDIIRNIEEEIFGTDTTKHLSVQNVLAGLHDYMNGKLTFIAEGKEWEHKQLNQYINEKIANEYYKVAAANFAAEKQRNEEFFAEKAKEPGMNELNGILYKEIKKGRGPRPTDGNMAIVEYEGHLIDGSIFDKTYAETNYPIDGAIEGLRIALKHMQPGTEWEVYIPWTLGYGAKGRGTSMPPFATLHYQIKLINFK